MHLHADTGVYVAHDGRDPRYKVSYTLDVHTRLITGFAANDSCLRIQFRVAISFSKGEKIRRLYVLNN